MKRKQVIKVNKWIIPNCNSIKFKSEGFHDLLCKFGLMKKKRSLEVTRIALNKNLNESLFHLQINLCSKLGNIIRIEVDENSEETKSIILEVESKWNKKSDNNYFKEAFRIIRRSNAYLLRHIWKTNKHYGIELSERKMNHLIGTILHKLNTGDNRVNLQRKWLQAPAPKCRSLSIPSLADRILASMWTEILELYLRGTMGDENHAYQCNKGTLTAWKDLLNNKLKGNWKYIYEFDLENFFPSVNHLFLIETLSGVGIPGWTISMLLEPLLVKPKMSLDLEVRDYQSGKESVFFKSIYEMLNYKGEANYEYGKSSLIGVPMGLGYSPLLATLILIRQLNEWKTDSNDYITYGDDGILFTNKLEDIQRFKSLVQEGKVKVNEGKSKWFKFDWEYVGTLKFLGLRWDPLRDRLFADTRKGSKIEMIRYVMEFPELGQRYLAYAWNRYINFTNMYKIRIFELEDIFFNYLLNHRLALKEGVFGVLLSKLYQGSFEDINYTVDEKEPLPGNYLIQEIGKLGVNIHNGSSKTIGVVNSKINTIRHLHRNSYKMEVKIHQKWAKSYLKKLSKEILMDLIPWEAGEYVEIFENNSWEKVYLRQIGSRNYEMLLQHLVNSSIDFRRLNVCFKSRKITPTYIKPKEVDEDDYCWTYKGFDLVNVKKWYEVKKFD